jgi:hypothetical protein
MAYSPGARTAVAKYDDGDIRALRLDPLTLLFARVRLKLQIHRECFESFVNCHICRSLRRLLLCFERERFTKRDARRLSGVWLHKRNGLLYGVQGS